MTRCASAWMRSAKAWGHLPSWALAASRISSRRATGCVVFGWDYIKWYEGLLADVDNVADALNVIGECGFPYEFCRIGESWDDIEFRASCNNEELAMHVEPSVVIEIV